MIDTAEFNARQEARIRREKADKQAKYRKSVAFLDKPRWAAAKRRYRDALSDEKKKATREADRLRKRSAKLAAATRRYRDRLSDDHKVFLSES